MKLSVEINNLAKDPIKKSFFVRVFKNTLAEVECDFLREKEISISVALVTPEEIKKLNRTYRRKNAVTDVLSFCEYKNQKSLREAVDKEIFLGELVLCYNDIEEYTLKNRKDFNRELAKVASHGLLHLLGFRHSPKMFLLQETVAKSSEADVKK